MKKNRKTRAEKVKASERQTQGEHITYTIPASRSEHKGHIEPQPVASYQLKDVRLITITTAVIIAANILLFALLTTNVIHFGILGY